VELTEVRTAGQDWWSLGFEATGLTDRDFGPWAARAWPRLSDDILTSYASGLPVAGGQAQQVGDVHRPHL
jgi:hypothetical protein